jgi:hypothetical protein
MKKAITTLIVAILIVHAYAALSVLVVSVAVAAKLCLRRTPKPHR